MRVLMTGVMIAALSACSVGGGAPLSGESADADYALEGFDSVALRGPDNVEISIGDEFSVRAEGDAEAIEDLEIEVRGDTLRIGRDNGSYFGIGGSRGRATVYVTLPALRDASVAGSGDMTVDSAEADEFEGSIAGSGNLRITELRAINAEFDIAGSGDIEVGGTAQTAEIGIAGSGSVSASDFRVERLDVDIAGSGDVEAYATESVDASLLGSGDVTVRGGAQCSSDSMGSGELRCSS